MNQDLERYKQRSLYLCDKIKQELKENEEEATSFFGGELYRTYAKVNDMAQEKTRRIRNKIRNT